MKPLLIPAPLQSKKFTFLKELPTFSGCYIFKDTTSKIIYIGKANNIRVRVKQYFTGQDSRWTLNQLVPKIKQIDYIQTVNSAEALILEANLIKKHQPYFNQMLKSGNHLAWIYIDTYAKYPTVTQVRQKDQRGRYFGPYYDYSAVQGLLRYLRTLYPYSTCQPSHSIRKPRACLHSYIGMCLGTCLGKISRQDYKQKVILPIIDLLNGKKQIITKNLQSQMIKLATEERFEEASKIRDRLYTIEYLGQNLMIQDKDDELSYGLLQQNRYLATVQELKKHFLIKAPLQDIRLEAYDITHFQGEGMYGSMVVAQGDKLKKNHYRVFKIKDQRNNDPQAIAEVIHRRIKYLDTLPKENTKQKNFEKNKDISFTSQPQIILIDGATEQVKAAIRQINKFVRKGKSIFPKKVKNEKIKSIIVIGISKGRHLRRKGLLWQDELWYFSPKGQRVIRLRLKFPHLLQHLRDEAHRFSRVFLHKFQKRKLQAI